MALILIFFVIFGCCTVATVDTEDKKRAGFPPPFQDTDSGRWIYQATCVRSAMASIVAPTGWPRIPDEPELALSKSAWM